MKIIGWTASFGCMLLTLAFASAGHAQQVDCGTNAQSLQGAPGTTHDVVCPSNCGGSTAWGSGIYSDDSSVCTAAIHAGVISRGSGGSVRVTIAGGQSSYPAVSQNGVSTSSWGSWGRSFTVSSMQQSQRVNLSCSQNAQTLNGSPGSRFEVTCPSGCGSSTVWGTDVYSDDSSICAAAIHAGVSSSSGGSFTVTIAPGQSSYTPSSRNGVTTSSWGAWGRSFTVGSGSDIVGSVSQTDSRMQLACSQNAQTLSGGAGTSFAVTCPSGCGSATVWGTGVYSDDSSICAAAIHAGVSSSSGGSFTVTILPGQSSYTPSSQNGVTTSSWGSWNRSFAVRRD